VDVLSDEGEVDKEDEEEEDSGHIEMMFQQCFPDHTPNPRKTHTSAAAVGRLPPEVVDLTDWDTDRRQRSSPAASIAPSGSRAAVEGLTSSMLSLLTSLFVSVPLSPSLDRRKTSKTLKMTTRTMFPPASPHCHTSGPLPPPPPLSVSDPLRTVHDLHRGGYHVIDFAKFTLSSVPSSRSRLSHYDARREKRSESKKRRSTSSPSSASASSKWRRGYSGKRTKS
jgi:hypothetical protein